MKIKFFVRSCLSKVFWALPGSDRLKENFKHCCKHTAFLCKKYFSFSRPAKSTTDLRKKYIDQILSIPKLLKHSEYADYSEGSFIRRPGDPKLIAYYLTQFHPTPENDLWWGKGITEWNNVTRAVPQYVGHIQPRLVGELGYYDLRLEAIMARQIELAKQYGLFGFSYYYYWFDGKRLLDTPLNLFLNNKALNFPFMLCWVNESWSKRFWGNDNGILIQQSRTEESYQAFIASTLVYFRDERYIRIDGKPILTIYRPSLIPNIQKVLEYWRNYCKKQGIGDIHLIGLKEIDSPNLNLIKAGFDAQTEFQISTLLPTAKNITTGMPFIRSSFGGNVLDYKDFVMKKRYFESSYPHLYRAITPMWDNTPRRNDKGYIFHGASPSLYKKWLSDLIQEAKTNLPDEDRFIFINAWNEWGEGAYLEPDTHHGYAYLEATRQAMQGI